jgi:alpha-L-fucosidase 2
VQAAATSFKNFKDVTGDQDSICRKTIQAIADKSYLVMRNEHIVDHRRLFRRVQIDLGTTESANEPTDQRIKNFAQGHDQQLAALYFHFGRYLLIAGSRPGTQPANLQGVWNDRLAR